MRTGPGASLRASLCAAAEESLASAAFCTGDFTDAERVFGQVLTMAELHGDRKAEARALGGLGMARHHRCIARLVAGCAPDDADVAAEQELMSGALAIGREDGDAVGTARALFGVGLVHQVLHRDWAAAMPYYWQAYGLAEAVEESGDLYACSEIHRHLGFYYLIEDVRPAEAVRRLGYSLALRERLGDPRRMPSGLVALGEAELAAGRPQRAVELLGRAARLAREAGLLPWRIEDAERSLSEAEAALASTQRLGTAISAGSRLRRAQWAGGRLHHQAAADPACERPRRRAALLRAVGPAHHLRGPRVPGLHRGRE